MNEIIYNKKCSFPGSIPFTKQENIFQIMIENYPSWKERLEKNCILSLDNKHDAKLSFEFNSDNISKLEQHTDVITSCVTACKPITERVMLL